MRRYSVLLIPDADVGGYTVLVPALPGCITEGDTLENALANAREAIALHVAGLIADGEPVPDESAPPELAAVEV
jgi:predicted RNase H-like HicB family nuclease